MISVKIGENNKNRQFMNGDLPWRYEIKFLLSTEQMRRCSAYFAPYMCADRQSPHKYSVMSLYWDDQKLSSLTEKNDGLYERAKYRLRSYDLENWIYEAKIKRGSRVKKQRSHLESLKIADVYRCKEYILANLNQFANSARVLPLVDGTLRPVIWIHYQRTAFTSLFRTEDLRITFDTDVRYLGTQELQAEADCFALPAALRSKLRPSLALREQVIMEIKFSRDCPYYIQAMLQELGLRQRSVSKYGICQDELLNTRIKGLGKMNGPIHTGNLGATFEHAADRPQVGALHPIRLDGSASLPLDDS